MFRTATWKANHKLAKSIADKGFYEFRRQLEYKCQWYSCELVVVVRFFPLSKTCSNFGHVQDMPLNVRIYDCPVCGISIDCDLNASINLRNAVGSTLNACGWVTADGLSWTRKYSRFTIELSLHSARQNVVYQTCYLKPCLIITISFVSKNTYYRNYW